MRQARVVGRTTVLGLCAATALAIGYPAVSGQTGRPAGTAKPDENRFSTVPAGRPLEIVLKQTTGAHDVYFVFRSPAATAIQPLMTLSSITLLY
jgi:hypothetical protein